MKNTKTNYMNNLYQIKKSWIVAIISFFAFISASQAQLSVNISGITNLDTICASTTPVTLSADITSGVGPYAYSWSTTETTSTISATPNSTTTYTVTITDNGAGGSTASAEIEVNVYPIPVYTKSNDTSICKGKSVTLTVNVPSPAAVYWLPGFVPSPSRTYTPNLTSTITAIILYQNDLCTTTANILVTVRPIPVITAMTSTICSNGTFTATPVNGANGIVPFGTTYSWSSPNVGTSGMTGGVAGIDQPNISGTLVNPANTAQKATYTVTPSSTACPGVTFTVIVTVDPTPAITDMNATACNATAFTVSPANTTNGIVPAGTTYTWGTPNVGATGITGGAAGTDATNINGNLTNPTNSAQTATYTVTPKSASCTGTPFNVQVTINPTPSITNITTSACSKTAFSTTPLDGVNGNIIPAGTTFSWGIPNVGASGMTGGTTGTAQASISGNLTNPTNTAQTATYTVTPSAGPCPGATFTVIVTINPTPAITNMTTPICSNSTFTANPVNITNGIVPAGTTYSWGLPNVGATGITGGAAGVTQVNISNTLVNPTITTQTATYTITPTSGVCVGSTYTLTVNVNPTPAINSMTSNSTSGSAFAVTPANPVDGIIPTGTTYSWGAPNVGATGITGGASGAAQANIGGNLTNPSNLVQTVTYTVTPTYSGCSGTPFTLTIDVNPKPIIHDMTAEICSGGTFSNLPINGVNGDIVPIGTTYSWGIPTVSAGITGGASGSAVSPISGTLNNSTNTDQFATYTVTPAKGSAIGDPFKVVVTVHPTPNVQSIANASTCTGILFTIAPTNGSGNIVPVTTTYSWGLPTVSVGITGESTGINQVNISNTLNNGTNAALSATYTVTPSISGACPGNPFTITVTVNPASAINSMASTTCSGIAFNTTPTDPANGMVLPGTTYSWGLPIVTGIMTGGATAIGQTSIGGTLTNPTNTVQTATYSVTPKTGTCDGASFNVIITVNPTPAITNMTDAICGGGTFTSTPANGANGIVPALTTYSWPIPSVSGGLTGGAMGSDQANISNTLVNPTNSLQHATYTITPKSADGCIGSTYTLTVAVNPTPAINAMASTICSANAFTIIPTNLTDGIVPAGTTYSWGLPLITGGITGASTGTDVAAPISETLTNPTNTAQTATYAITPTVGGTCPGSPFNLTITVNAAAFVNAGIDQIVCSGAPITTLNGSVTGGISTGTWSKGTGFFNPTTSTLNALYTPSPPELAAHGIVTLRLTSDDPDGAGPCPTVFDEMTITINETPIVDAGLDQEMCLSSSVNLGGTPTASGGTSAYTFVWDNGAAATANPVVSPAVNTTYSLTVTDSGNGCSATGDINITVNPLPTADAGGDKTICSGSTTTLDGNASGGTGLYSWNWSPAATAIPSNGQNPTVNPSAAGGINTDVTYTLTVTDAKHCTSTDEAIVTVKPAPIVTIGLPTTGTTSCIATDGAMTASASGGSGVNYDFAWSNTSSDNNVPSSTISGLAVGLYIVTATDLVSGCTDIDVATINSSVAPPTITLVNSDADNNICAGTSVTFTASGAPQYEFYVDGVSTQGPSATATYTTNTLTNGQIIIAKGIVPGCDGFSAPINITVNQIPIANAGSDVTICNGQNTQLTGSGGGTYLWSPNTNLSDKNDQNPFANPSTATTYTLKVDINGCTATDAVIVKVNDPATANAGGTSTDICANATTNLAGATATNYSSVLWTKSVLGDGIFSNAASVNPIYTPGPADKALGTVILTLTAYGNTPCGDAQSNITVNIHPVPSLSSTLSPSAICGGSTFIYTPTSTLPGSTFTWSRAGIVGITEAGKAGITGGISETLTNTTTNPINVTYTFSTQEFCTSALEQVIVRVDPTPNISAMTAISCTGTAFSATPVNSTNGIVPPGTTYSWSAPSVTGSMTGGTSGSGSADINGTLTNNTNTAQTATYTVTPKVGSCSGNTFDVVVTVNPKPAITNLTKTICGGNSFTASPSNGVDGVVPASTTYSWGAPTVDAGIIGGAGGGAQANISNSLTNNTINTLYATYTVTPTSGVGGCIGNPFTITVTVNPTPSVNNMTDQICSGATFTETPINGGGNIIPAGTTYSWTSPIAGGGVTGGVAGSGADITGTLTNPTNTAHNVTYTVTPLTVLCSSLTTFNVVITVNPKPNVSDYAYPTCSGVAFATSPTNGVNGVVPIGTTYSWNTPSVSGSLILKATGINEPNINGTFNNTTNIAQNAIYIVTPTFGSCIGTTFTTTITVNPTPNISNINKTTCSGTAFIVPVTAQGADIIPIGTTYSWNAPSVTGGMTGGAIGSGASLSGNLTNPTNGVQSATYTITPTSGSCPGNTFSVIVSVNPTPHVQNTTQTAICSGNSFTSNPADGGGNIVPADISYSWNVTNGGTTGGVSGSGTSISGTLSNPTNTTKTAQYTITPTTTIGICLGAPFTIDVPVNPTPSITDKSTSVCTGSLFTVSPVNGVGSDIVPAPISYAWSLTSANGTTGGVGGSGANITGTLANSTNTALTAQYTVTPTATTGTCQGNTFKVNVTVNPTPNITDMDSTVCSGITFSTTPINGVNGIVPANIDYSWAVPTVTLGNITGGTGGNTLSKISGTLINTTNTVQKATYTIIPRSGSCIGATFTSIVTVNPKPLVQDITPAAICSGNSFTATPVDGSGNIVPAGTQYSWANPQISANLAGFTSGTNVLNNISDALTNTSNVNQTATYTVTPSSGGCAGASFKIDITVKPVPTINNIVEGAICTGTSFTTSPANGTNGIIPTTGVSYSWGSPSLPVGITTTGIATGTNAVNISGTLANSTNAQLSATYTVTPSISNGCPDGSTFTVIVPVNPIPAITDMVANTCTGVSFTSTPTNIVNGIVPAGTTYTWNAPVVSGGITGGTGGVAQTNISNTLVNPTNLIQTAEYTITPTAGTCIGTAFKLTVTLNPAPTISNITTTSCSGNSFTVAPANGVNGIVPIGTTYNWSTPIVSGGLTGGATGTNAANISETLTNPTNIAQTAVYTITPSIGGSCPGSTFKITVTVNPIPAINAMIENICSGGAFSSTPTNGVNGVIPTGTTYSWNAPAVSGGITGGASGTALSSISGTLVNPTNTLQTATYTVTPTGCSNISFTITVNVNPTPAITAMTPSVCSGNSFTASPVDGVNGIVPIGTKYSWGMPVVTGGITGGAIVANALNISGTLTNPTNAIQTAQYSVTPTIGSCPGALFIVTVTVNPMPNITNMSATICSGTPFTTTPANATNGIVPTGTTYNWGIPFVTGGLTGGAANVGAANINGTLTNPTAVAQTAIYSVTSTAGTCTGNSFIVTYTVNPTPLLNNNPTPVTICGNTSFNYIPTSSTSGATYSWTRSTIAGITPTGTTGTGNVSETLINTTAAPIAITYTVITTANGCPNAGENILVTVNPAATVNAGANQWICSIPLPASATLNGTIGGGATSATWTNISGTFNTNANDLHAVYTPTLAEIATGKAVLILRTNDPDGAGPCPQVESNDTIFYPQPPSAKPLASPLSVCNNNSIQLTGSGFSYSSVIWTGGTGVFNLATDSITVYTPGPGDLAASPITLTFTTNGIGTCSNSAPSTMQLTINSVPTADAGADFSICPNTTATLIGSALGGTAPYTKWTWSGANIGANTQSTTATPIALTTYKLTVTDNNGCEDIDSVHVNIYNVTPPIITPNGPLTYCKLSDINLTLDANIGYNPYQWKKDNVNFGGNTQSTLVNDTASYTVVGTDINTCISESAPVKVVLSIPKPLLVADGPTSLCEGDFVFLHTTIPFYTYDWSSGSTTAKIKAMETGIYTVTVTDNFNCTGISNAIPVTVDQKPNSSFGFSDSLLTVNFYNFSQFVTDTTKYRWIFGDGSSVHAVNPIHVYSAAGTYTVTLVATNGCDSTSYSMNIKVVSITGIKERNAISAVNVFPNPANDVVNLNIESTIDQDVSIRIRNTIGQVVYENSDHITGAGLRKQIEVSNLNTGMYLVEIRTTKGIISKKLMIQR